MQWCVHNTGGYGVKADALFRILDCKAPGCRIQTALGHHRNRSIQAGDRLICKRRRDAHHISRFLLQHLFYRELGDVKESQKVDGDQGVEIFDSKVREWLGAQDSSAIHQNIDGPKVLDGCFDNFGSSLLLADIAIDENQAGRGRRLVDTERGCDDVIAASLWLVSDWPGMPCGYRLPGQTVESYKLLRVVV